MVIGSPAPGGRRMAPAGCRGRRLPCAPALAREKLMPVLENFRLFSKWIFVLETKGVGRKDMTDLTDISTRMSTT
jgi:hypothetical protein